MDHWDDALDGPSGLRAYVPQILLDWPEGQPWRALDGTLVSADISGFTALSERLADRGREGAEELSLLICDCFDGMIEDCHERGGDVVKFGGDAILVWFHGDAHAIRAARAAHAMRQTIKRRRTMTDGTTVRVGVSIGLHSGVHYFFSIEVGSEDLIVAGPGATATVSAESAAGSGQILVSAATAELLPVSWLGERVDGDVGLEKALARPLTDWQHTETTTRDASAFIPDDQRAQIVAGALNEHRQVAVAFLGLGGVDAPIGRGDVDDVADKLGTLSRTLTDVCETYGVFLLSTDVYPDGAKLIFTAGAPLSRGDDEERLLRAMREIIDADPGLQLRAGVNRGAVFAGDLGSARRRTYTCMGDAVNLAARLMSKARPGEIIVTRPTMEWASSRFAYEPLEPFHVKGKTVPIYAGRLGEHLGRSTDLDRVEYELVGRRREVEDLMTRATDAWSGRSDVVAVAGGPGIGKSRLAIEPTRRVDVEVAFTRCQPFDRFAAWTVAEPIVRTLLGIDVEAKESVAGRQLIEWLQHNAASLLPLAPLLAAAIDADVPATAESALVLPEFRRDRTLQLLHELIGVAVTSPTWVLIDDAQHADDATRELVELISRDPLPVPLFIVATTPPDDRLAVGQIRLGPLAEVEIAEMVDDLLGERAITPATVRSIVTRSQGNPLFAGELVRALAEDPDADIPESLEAMVEVRLDTLEPADRRLLRTASVLGSEVDIELLARMVDGSLIQRQDRWDRLDRFLERVGAGLVRFRFDTYHRVVYGGLSYRSRRTLHGRLVDVLERQGATETREQLALLAFHASRGADRPRTWNYAVAAAAAATEAAMFGESARLYSMALGAQPRDAADETIREVAERAGDVYEVVGEFDHAERMLALAQRKSIEPRAKARLLRKRAEVAERQGEHARALRHLQRASRVLVDAPWHETIRDEARIQSAKSVIAIRQSRLSDAWELATSALSKAQLIEDWSTASHAALMVDNLVTSLRWEGVEIQRPDVVEFYRRADDPVGEAKYRSNRATDAYYDGDWSEAVRLNRAAATQSAEHGHIVSEATCLHNIAEIFSDQGRLDEARSLFRDAGRSWRAIGYTIGLALLEANLGRLATRSGAYDEAEHHLATAHDEFRALGATTYVTEVELRHIENAAFTDVPERAWPDDADLDADLTLRLYADRLRAIVSDDRSTAIARLAEAVERADSAGLPFESAQLLRVLAEMTGDGDAQRRADRIFADLGGLAWPRLPPMRS